MIIETKNLQKQKNGRNSSVKVAHNIKKKIENNLIKKNH